MNIFLLLINHKKIKATNARIVMSIIIKCVSGCKLSLIVKYIGTMADIKYGNRKGQLLTY
jgi:hypothetical protein